MSKTRKVLGIILAIVLTLNVMAIAVFAADDSDRANEWTLVSDAFTTEPTVGSNFTVDLKLKANYNLGPVQFALEYDSASFDIAPSGAIDIAGYPYDATVSYNYDTAAKMLRVVIVPDTAGLSNLQAVKLPASTTIATITFTYLKGGSIEVADDYKTDANIDGTLCAFRSLKDNLLDCSAGDLVYGQTHTITEGDHDIGTSYTAPVLSSAAGYNVYVDTGKTFGGKFDGALYGFSGASFIPAAYLNTQLSVSDGYIKTIKTPYWTGVGDRFGTGATVELYDVNDVLCATYVVIIFGDANGDGLINAPDATTIIKHYGGSPIPNGPRVMAANVSLAGVDALLAVTNAADAVTLIKHYGGTPLSQSVIGARYYACALPNVYGSTYTYVS